MKIKKEDLIGLFNELYLDNQKIINVKYAGKTIFMASLDKNVRVRSIISKDEVELLKQCDEMPSYEDFKVCFYTSNVLKWKNQEAVLKKVAKEINREPYKGDRKIYLSFDSCTLRHRSNAVIRQLLYNIHKFVGIVIPQGVIDEVKGWDNKYKEVEELSKHVYDARKFLGQLTLNSRKTKIGYYEARSILKSMYAVKIESEPKDEKILASLKKFQKDNDSDILILSEDANFVEMAQSDGIHSELIIQQKELPISVECTWGEFGSLIYYTAIIFGAIKVNHKKILGIWPGKTPDEWYEKVVDVD
ncbi:MAG: hypothetical protein KJ561_04665 [Nanoarchaeota archaeon]|nr:hypothetical protein [Nanoarchaeota archaeon]